MDIMLKNKIVHLPTIHGKTFETPPIFFQQENCNFLLQKEVVLLTISHHQSYWGKKPLFSLRFLLLYKKVKWLGCPKWPLGFPTFCFPNASLFKCPYKIYTKYKIGLIPHEEGPTWVSKNFLHADASAAIPSKAQGSKNWILISNLATWFLMASILAGLNWSWSSKNCTLTAGWPTSFFKTRSSMALICCVLAFASWYLLCNIPINVSWSGNSSSLCSASVWHRLYVLRSLLKYSKHAPFVLLTKDD